MTSSFIISPIGGPAGTPVQILGSNFGPSATVNLTIDGQSWQTVTADGEGFLRGNFPIPQISGGPKIITVSGGSGGGVTASFEITPTITIDVRIAYPGWTINVPGSGFRANETGISIRFDNTTVATGITADTLGQWSSLFKVPSTTTAGNHSISASGSFSSNVPSVQLSIGAGVILDRTSGPPGTLVKISGSGVSAEERITIDIGGGLATDSATADNQGVWSADIAIPPAPRGSLSIRASGRNSQATTSFSVTPTMVISDPTGSPGNAVSIEGKGFAANQAGIPITFDGDIVTSATANTQGSWRVNFTVPPAPKGTYSIKVTGTAPELQAPFTINPALSLNRTQAGPGESATVSGAGFESNETGITVSLGDTTIATGISANADGSWSTEFAVPDLPYGSYAVVASGALTSAGSVNERSFNVSTLLILSFTAGPPGSIVSITGRGFGANEQDISIAYDGVAVVSGMTADGLGAFTTSFVVPPSPAGRHSVVVSGSAPGLAVDSDISFQVVPGIAINHASGSPGATMMVVGAGFGANERDIEIRYDTNTVLSGISADVDGAFDASFLIPPSPAGQHDIQAFGPTSTLYESRPQERFTVVPGVALSETAGSVGMDLAVAGRGFSPSSTITLTYDDLTEATVVSDEVGSFNIRFAVPESRQGDHLVKLLDEAGNRVQETFVVETETPILTVISPTRPVAIPTPQLTATPPARRGGGCSAPAGGIGAVDGGWLSLGLLGLVLAIGRRGLCSTSTALGNWPREVTDQIGEWRQKSR